MPCTLLGEVDVEFELDHETGHRDYDVTWLVATDNQWLGPYSVLHTPGLPAPGSPWVFGPYGEQAIETDPYATCQYYAKIRPRRVKEGPVFYWEVQQRFSTRPYERSIALEYTTPMDEFAKVRGGYVRRTEEALYDRFRNILQNTAFERFTGKEVEFEMSSPQIFISMNFATLVQDGEDFLAGYINTLNDQEIWGFPKRTVKLSDVTWEQMFFGADNRFYTATLEFDVSIIVFNEGFGDVLMSGFDRDLLNRSQHVLIDGADPDAFHRPKDFKLFLSPVDKERKEIILKFNGKPWDPTTPEELQNPPTFHVQKYAERNFLELGVPSYI